ncbi:MAG: hypothetical protein HY331_09935 [Chloroflexi bacterium]|nr:hypothetical protein [Chloroflexota bacterium]
MSLTVCTVNFRTWEYLYFQDFTFRRLAADPGFKRLICNVTPGNDEADRLARLPNTTVFHVDLKGLVGSESHGAALNHILPRIETEYAVIADPDTAVLTQGWDTVCRSALDERRLAIGSPYHPSATFRYQGFPNVIFLFFAVESVRQLGIDFRPEPFWIRNLKRRLRHCLPAVSGLDRDVGWQLPERFGRAGHQAVCFDFYKCHDAQSVVLAPDARGDEFHWRGVPIVTHQGRAAPRGFNQDPVSRMWLERVCAYLQLDRRVADDVVRS